MPVIDLKHVLIYIEDGTLITGTVGNSKSGTVNNVSGYTAGATVILVTGFTGIIPTFSNITITGQPYLVVAHTETSGNTTQITIAAPGIVGTVANGDPVVVNGYGIGATVILPTSAFASAPPAGARIDINGDDKYTVTASSTTSVTITPALTAIAASGTDLTAYGVYLKLHVGDGTLTWDEKRPRDYKKDRGLLYQVRDGDQEPMDVSFNLLYEEITGSNGDPPSPEDALKQRGAAASWVSAETTDPCAPYAVNLRLDNFQQPGCTAVQAERVVLPNFRYESLNHNPKDGTIACQGKCNAREAIVSRFTASTNPTA